LAGARGEAAPTRRRRGNGRGRAIGCGDDNNKTHPYDDVRERAGVHGGDDDDDGVVAVLLLLLLLRRKCWWERN